MLYFRSAPRCFPSVWVRSGQLKRTVGLTAFFYVSSIAQKHVAVCNLAYISFFVLQNVATRLVALFIVSKVLAHPAEPLSPFSDQAATDRYWPLSSKPRLEVAQSQTHNVVIVTLSRLVQHQQR